MAGRIPQSFIDELLTRTDIVEVIDDRVQLKKAGREYKACCPFHNEKTPSFTVSQVKQFYHCFGCGEHGTAITFLMDYEHMDFVEAVEELAHRAGLEVPRDSAPESNRTAVRSRVIVLPSQTAPLSHNPITSCLKRSPSITSSSCAHTRRQAAWWTT